MKKYEFTGETKTVFSQTLYQIRALVDIEKHNVKKGDLGGWIEKENNLAQSDDAWVSGDAYVSGNAWVSGDARVYGNARVYDDAWVCGDVWEASPLYIQGTRFSFSVSTKNKIRVGCQIHTFYAWNKSWKKIASEYGLSEEEQKEYIMYFNLACDRYGKEKYKIDLEKAFREAEK